MNMDSVSLQVFRCRLRVTGLAVLVAATLLATGCGSSPNPRYPEISSAVTCPASVHPSGGPAITVRMDRPVDSLSATVGTRIIAISTKSYPIKFAPRRSGCVVRSGLGGGDKRVTEFIVVAPGHAQILFVVGTGGPTGQGLVGVRTVSVRITR